jgi:hypothetical protein
VLTAQIIEQAVALPQRHGITWTSISSTSLAIAAPGHGRHHKAAPNHGRASSFFLSGINIALGALCFGLLRSGWKLKA